jgi:predicted flap endonuclease-1-like 5' DNA nuclease
VVKDREAEIARLRGRLKSAEDDRKQIADLSRRVAELEPLDGVVKEREAKIDELSKLLAERAAAPAAAPRKPKTRTRAKGQLFTPPPEKDDLKKIYGIGPVLEKALNRLGVTSFQQVARFTREDIDRVSAAIEFFPDRILRDDWISGAKEEYRKKYGRSL